MLTDVQQDALKRLSYISGHIEGIRRMIESNTYCVDVLKQTHAVRRAIEKLETLLLEGHLRSCVPGGIKDGNEDQVIQELVDLYDIANR